MRKPSQIDTTTLRAADAQSLSHTSVLENVATVRWAIDRNRVTFEKDDCHTLSLYMSGGETSHRADQPGHTGGPGLICLMPQGQITRWAINGPIEFHHLYLTDTLVRQFGAKHCDTDARRIDLKDSVYADDACLTALLIQYFSLCEAPEGLPAIFGEQTLYAILDRLVRQYNSYSQSPTAISGGLCAKHQLLVRDLIAASISAPPSIPAMAAEVGLSPYHFARMFKDSFGVSPAQYVLAARLDHVRAMLRGNDSLAAIAAATGFSQQSHMTMQFKRAIGVTPSRYRDLVKSA